MVVLEPVLEKQKWFKKTKKFKQKMVANTKVNGMAIFDMEQVVVFGLTERSTKGSGRMASWMAMESTHGLMEKSMRESSKMTRNMEKVRIHTKTVAYSKENIKTDGSMDKVSVLQGDRLRQVYGLMGGEKDGQSNEHMCDLN